MRYLTFTPLDKSQPPRLGTLYKNDMVIDLAAAKLWAAEMFRQTVSKLPANMIAFIQAGSETWSRTPEIVEALEDDNPLRLRSPDLFKVGWKITDVTINTPILRPPTVRDFYAFETHVAAAQANRGKEVPKEWYQMPVFYFSNPHTIFGPYADVPMPQSTQALDYELEIACVIGKAGQDIPAEKAHEHIFGYMLFNDWSARDVQAREMSVGLGPAKGKDFASTLGPWIVTPDELADKATDRPGVYDLQMVASINGKEYSRGNWKDIYYSFGQMIARASADVPLLPGDVIGSGTVGSGCLLELTQGKGPWLQRGNVVELEVERLGVIRNRVY
ncbi:MAG: fumarylacetoacetate hydrolase family protein [Anaerolineales bacterium]|nr:fumarylacetoacetate hydrolase family protein [Anaerolineales bacterium]